MINPFREVNWRPDTAAKRTFAKSIAAGLPVVALILGGLGWFRMHVWPVWTWWLAAIGLAGGTLLWLVPGIARPFYVLWQGVGCCMAFVAGNFVVAAVYFLVVTPIGLLLRVSGRDPLERRFEPERGSYWKDAENVPDAERYFRQY